MKLSGRLAEAADITGRLTTALRKDVDRKQIEFAKSAKLVPVIDCMPALTPSTPARVSSPLATWAGRQTLMTALSFDGSSVPMDASNVAMDADLISSPCFASRAYSAISGSTPTARIRPTPDRGVSIFPRKPGENRHTPARPDERCALSPWQWTGRRA